MPDPKTYAPEETIALLQARANASQSNAFTVKIFRKRQLGDRPDCIATVGDAEIAHVSNPEQWVPRLCGGGMFSLSVYHASDPTLPIGGMIQCNFDGLPKAPDRAAMGAQDWPGPRTLLYPALQPQPQFPINYSNLPQGGFPAGQSTASPNTVPGLQLGSPHPFTDPRIDQLTQQLNTERAAANAEIKRLNDERLADRERAAEDRRQNDLKAIRAENAAAMADLKATFSAGAKPAGGLTEIMTALTPIATQILAGQQEASRQAAAQAQTSAAKTDVLLTTLLSRPAIDPALLAIISSKGDGDSGMAHYMEAMSSMSKASIDLIRTAGDIQMGNNPPEPPAMMAIREVSKGLALIGAGMSQSIKKKKDQQQPPRPPALAQLPVAAAPQKGSGAQPPSGNGPNGQQAVHKPLNGAAAPGFAGVPVTQFAKSEQEINRGQVQAWATAGQRPMGPDVIDQLKAMIMRYDPINDVALSFIYAINEDAMQDELGKVNFSIMNLISTHLGDWAMADPEKNAAYLRDLGQRVEVLGRESGIFEDDDDAGDDDQQDDQDDGDQDDDQDVAVEEAAATHNTTPET